MSSERYIYEPRAFWETFSIAADASPRPRANTTKDHWFNGSRYPITLTHLLISPINYTRREGGAASPSSLSEYHNAGAIMQRANVFLSRRGVSNFSRYFISTHDLTPAPRGEPSMLHAGSGYESGLFGISRWDFDKPLRLPRQGVIDLEFSNITRPIGLGAPSAPVVSYVWSEYGGRFGGRTRRLARTSLAYTSTGGVWPAGPQTFDADGFGVSNSPPVVGQTFPGDLRISGRSFRGQERTRGVGETAIGGFAVAIDQIDYDDDLQSAVAVQGDPLAPISQRIRCNARTTAGGTGEDWWREGAPLSLVTPTIGSALVYPLPDPITLGPGEQLEGVVEVPGTNTALSPNLSPTYNLGISLTGYATVEG